MAQRLVPLAVLGNMIVDEAFARDMLDRRRTDILEMVEGAGFVLPAETSTEGATQRTEITRLVRNLRDSAELAKVELDRLRADSGCPNKPCPRNGTAGGLKVLALLGNACVEREFREAFFADPLGASVEYFPITGLNEEDEAELRDLASLDTQKAARMKDGLANLHKLARCPMGCPRGLVKEGVEG